MNKIQTPLSATIRPVAEYSNQMLADKWGSLEARIDAPFSLSWCWMASWLRLVQPRTEVFVFECYGNDTLCAMSFLTVCPAKRLKGHIRIRQLQLNEYRTPELDMSIAYNGLLVDTRHLDAAWGSFFRAASGWSKRWDEIALNSLMATQYDAAKGQLKAWELETDRVFKTWKVAFEGPVSSLEDLISSFKQKSRQQLRQTHRAYQELGELTTHAAASAEEALALFQDMGAVHTERWRKVGKSGSYANANWVTFHSSIIEQCFDSGNVQVLEVRCAGKPIGFLYGHVYRGTVYMQQTGFQQTDSTKYRPGYISHCMAMLSNLREGNKVYDFLPDSEDSYKRFFTREGDAVYFVRAVRPRLMLRYEKVLRKVASRFNFRGNPG
jgi:hypothetical protein